MCNEEYVKNNRQKRMTPKRVKYWCAYCDCSLVADGRKCKVCGSRNRRHKRLRKETNG